MLEFPKLLYRGKPYPHGETCRVGDASELAEKLSQGWRLTSAYALPTLAELGVEPVGPVLAAAESVTPVVIDTTTEASVLVVDAEVPVVPKKRGRPRKE